MSVSFLGARICQNRFRVLATIQNVALGLVLCCLMISQSQASSGFWQSPADETMLDDVYIRSNNSLGSPTTSSVSGVHTAVTYRNLWRWFDLDTVNALRASYVDSGYLALTLKSTSFIGDGEALVYSLRPLERVFKEDSTDWYNANTKGDPNGTDSIAWNTAGGDYGVASDPGGARADSVKIYKSAGTVYQINQLGDTSVATVDDTVYFWFSSTWATESIDTSADLKFELVADRIDGNSTVRIDYHSSESGTASQRPYVKLFYHSNDIALIVADTTSLGADSTLRDRIEDSLTTASGERFRVNVLDDLDSHNQRTDTAYWAEYLLAIWASGTFGSYHIADQPIPVMTFNRYHYNEYSLGSASKTATAGKLLLNLHSSWLTDRISADTLYTIQGSNLAFGEIIGVSDTADDVKAVTLTLSSAGPDTSVMVVVDSAGRLFGAAGSAPNRRIFMGNMGAINLLTWAQGWEMFNRAFYYALADTTNVMVRQEINISDRWGSASTWFETGSCDNATLSNSSTMRPGFDNGVHLGALLRYDSLTEIIGPAPPGSLTVIDSAKVSLYLTSSNAYNLDGTDSSFDYRLYVA